MKRWDGLWHSNAELNPDNKGRIEALKKLREK
jgi:hypothetical protein